MKSWATGIVRGMARSASTLLPLLLAAGCTGQTVEGRWRGPFPLVGAKECDLSLRSDRTATIACDGTAIVGAGRYAWDGSRLSLNLPTMTRGGRVTKGEGPFEFKIDGRGNALSATREDVVYEWTRTIP